MLAHVDAVISSCSFRFVLSTFVLDSFDLGITRYEMIWCIRQIRSMDQLNGRLLKLPSRVIPDLPPQKCRNPPDPWGRCFCCFSIAESFFHLFIYLPLCTLSLVPNHLSLSFLVCLSSLLTLPLPFPVHWIASAFCPVQDGKSIWCGRRYLTSSTHGFYQSSRC